MPEGRVEERVENEVLAVVQTAMLGGMPYTVLRDAIFTHPTMAEGLYVLLATTPV